MGILIYGIPFIISILCGVEKISGIPNFNAILQNSLPFAFGLLFSSASEDILTRGLIYRNFVSKIGGVLFVLFSSFIYVLNHIYKLGNGFETLLYLFLLGVVFAIPLVITKRLWLTSAMHWSGNVFFFISHEVIKTESLNSKLGYNSILSIFLFSSILFFLSLLKNRRRKFG